MCRYLKKCPLKYLQSNVLKIIICKNTKNEGWKSNKTVYLFP